MKKISQYPFITHNRNLMLETFYKDKTVFHFVYQFFQVTSVSIGLYCDIFWASLVVKEGDNLWPILQSTIIVS